MSIESSPSTRPPSGRKPIGSLTEFMCKVNGAERNNNRFFAHLIISSTDILTACSQSNERDSLRLENGAQYITPAGSLLKRSVIEVVKQQPPNGQVACDVAETLDIRNLNATKIMIGSTIFSGIVIARNSVKCEGSEQELKSSEVLFFTSSEQTEPQVTFSFHEIDDNEMQVMVKSPEMTVQFEDLTMALAVAGTVVAQSLERVD